jgi:hypothetical protein
VNKTRKVTLLLSKQKIIALGIMLLVTLSVQADSLLPEIPKAKRKYSEKTLCVEPVEEMRKNHMDYIMHQRDDTMRQGIRTSKHSLKECIDCHNAPADDGKVASIESEEHFCSSCHTYAGVSIDCFSCHNDKPANTQYRHGLSSDKMPHHKFSDDSVTADMLEKLAAAKEPQQ